MTSELPQQGPWPVAPDEQEHFHCPNCGYDLTGLTSQRCPECGFGFDLPALRHLASEAFHRCLAPALDACNYCAIAIVASCFTLLAGQSGSTFLFSGPIRTNLLRFYVGIALIAATIMFAFVIKRWIWAPRYHNCRRPAISLSEIIQPPADWMLAPVEGRWEYPSGYRAGALLGLIAALGWLLAWLAPLLWLAGAILAILATLHHRDLRANNQLLAMPAHLRHILHRAILASWTTVAVGSFLLLLRAIA